jgi:hypothetical protein
MIDLRPTTDRRTPASSMIPAEKAEWRRGPCRRFDRILFGFWLGGGFLGTVGCVFGACMPYHHPVARVISVLWWGIYCGCLGASLGALPGLMLQRPLARIHSRPVNVRPAFPGKEIWMLGPSVEKTLDI